MKCVLQVYYDQSSQIWLLTSPLTELVSRCYRFSHIFITSDPPPSLKHTLLFRSVISHIPVFVLVFILPLRLHLLSLLCWFLLLTLMSELEDRFSSLFPL